EAADPGALAARDDTERIVPERIASHSPEARLVAILRDPVERAYSHYLMERLRKNEQRPYQVAIDELLRPERLEQSRRVIVEQQSYVTFGEYGRVLAPYFELFPRDRIHVCFTRELAEQREQTLAAVLRFLVV